MSVVELKKENRLGFVTINRPKVLNALNAEVLSELDQIISNICQDKEIDVVIFSGAGEKAFVAGADISEMKDKSPQESYTFARQGQVLFQRIQELPQPTIAAINGFALGGGCELAMSCDMRIATDKAKFGQPEVALGIIPGFGGTQRLPRLIGRAKAMEIILTGRTISAVEALDLGLVNKVVSAENLLAEAVNLAEAILAKGPYAIRQAKVAINKGLEVDINIGCELEGNLFALCFGEEQKEGMSAFLEKRAPIYEK
ncbi:enoyl-CoA hydratase-related protein [Desulfosporosinus sp.]|uniref:enoyl-CoA hydratase-related protein n=1 Tax=Desulfosporosinus sp. TaxID=157907 RepID=UPI0025BA5A70|nr:enoyl-CoA hydratase-related protein [Desulfosporosinus sp.]MBC2722401.1 enoyl-CoA hydratase/isomerase family protein [Desulfosporosinus sp.]MBC2726568.1 enoyl-CoA hydratase/isomerase family protein [Desulfosporosinus sp.]